MTKFRARITISLIIIAVSSIILLLLIPVKNAIMTTTISSANDVIKLFPTTTSAIEHRTESIIKSTKQAIDEIIQIESGKRNFENTIRALDTAVSNFGQELSILELINNAHPDQLLRDAAQQATVRLKDFYVDYISQNVDLYKAVKDYTEHTMAGEKLNNEEIYFITEMLKDYKRNGLDLPPEKRAKVAQLKKEIAELSLQFDNNINSDESSIQVSKDELAGLDEDFINNLKKVDDKYILGTDYPTYFQVMEQADVGSTRQKLYYAFKNRAYPANVELLEKIIAKRDALAKELGFESYAALDIDSEMAKTDKRVEQFLNDLLKRVAPKEEREFKTLIQDLPSSVKLVNNKFNSWDKLYAETYYKKKHFDVDENKMSQYFPMEHTVQALLDIYKQFFSLEFKEIPISQAWDKDVQLFEVWRNYNNKKVLLGYLFLDLYPRPNKYSHACNMTIVPVTKKGSIIQPGVTVVLANFPKSTATKPSLLKLNDVSTFFHEFGHALHSLLGATELAGSSGTQVKMDFVEMPSQMLEEWLWDKDILKMVSHHYQTGEPMPDELIDRIIDLKNFSTGDEIQRQILFALLSLDYYKAGAHKNTTQILRDLERQIQKHAVSDDKNHFQASFGHLTNYASKYYSYLWSKVFALDLFDTIKKQGLLNPVIGNEYIEKVLGKGGSEDPNKLLYDFLGREPNQEAFLHDLGLEK